MLGRVLRRIRLAQRLKFFLERAFLRGASVQLLAVAALLGLISLIGGLLVLPLPGGADGLGEAVWWAFLRLSDPGYLGDDQGAWRRVVSTVLTVAGYVVFLGALVAIMTQWLNARMRALESGLTPVATRNHIVILGWTSRTLPVVGELMQSEGRVRRFLARRRGSRRLRLVVLADQVTPWHAQTLRDEPAVGSRAREIVLRSGSPLVVDDLERVDCFNAAAVIIPSGSAVSGLSADMATVKALLSLSSHPGSQTAELPYVVAEIQDQRKATVARRAYQGPLELVSGNSVISRLLAQNLRHRGLSRLYKELLSHRLGCGVYIREEPSLQGATFAEAAWRFPNAVAFGLVRWNDGAFVPHLNPPADLTLEADDRLVLVAESYEAAAPDPTAVVHEVSPPADLDPGVSPAPPARQGQRVLVLGWNRKVASLIHELDTYDGERFDVTTVSLVSERARRALLEDYGALTTVTCEHLERDFVVEDELRALNPGSYDHVVLASSERLATGEEADTRSVVAYLLLEALLETSEAVPQIILELQDPDNEPLIAGRRAEVIISPLILAHMIAQVALRRELMSVFDELFTAGGPELVFRAPSALGLAAEPRSFQELEALVRGRGETLLGVYYPAKDELFLSPPREHRVSLDLGAELVVVTTLA